MRQDNEGAFTIPKIGKIEFEGFFCFINQGLMKELHNFPKIENTNKHIESRIFVNEYELVKPFITKRDVVYISSLHITMIYMRRQDQLGGIVEIYRNKLCFS
jgi:hypothetical protein